LGCPFAVNTKRGVNKINNRCLISRFIKDEMPKVYGFIIRITERTRVRRNKRFIVAVTVGS
jgi:hypothetical protein